MTSIDFQNQVHVGSRRFFSPDQLLHLQSELNYTMIFLTNGQTFLSSTTLKTIEQRLYKFKHFIRINRQSIVNANFLSVDNDLSIVLPNNQKLQFSRRKAKEFLKSIEAC